MLGGHASAITGTSALPDEVEDSLLSPSRINIESGRKRFLVSEPSTRELTEFTIERYKLTLKIEDEEAKKVTQAYTGNAFNAARYLLLYFKLRQKGGHFGHP